MPQVIEHSKKLCSNQILSALKKDNTVQYLHIGKTCHNSEKIVQYSNNGKTCKKSEKDGTILKQNKIVTSQKKWHNTQTVPKPANSQKNMVQYSNRAKTCHQSKKMVQN